MVDLMEFKSSMSGAGNDWFAGAEKESGRESGTGSVDADVAAAEGTVRRGGACRSVGLAFSLLLLDGKVLGSCSCDEV